VITTRRIVGYFALLLLLACKESPRVAATPRKGLEQGCSPTFYNASPGPIRTKAGTWTIEFSVALIGCRDQLGSLTPAETEAIGRNLENSPDPLVLQLFVDPSAPELGKTFTQRVNTALGRIIATDALIYQVVVIDNLQPYG